MTYSLLKLSKTQLDVSNLPETTRRSEAFVGNRNKPIAMSMAKPKSQSVVPKSGNVFLFDDKASPLTDRSTKQKESIDWIKSITSPNGHVAPKELAERSHTLSTFSMHLKQFNSKYVDDEAWLYKLKKRSILKTFPGLDPTHVKLTKNQREPIAITEEIFELAAATQDSTRNMPTTGSANTVPNPPVPSPDTTFEDATPKDNELPRVNYQMPLSSYTTSHPPWVNQYKIKQNRRPVAQALKKQPKYVYEFVITS